MLLSSSATVLFSTVQESESNHQRIERKQQILGRIRTFARTDLSLAANRDTLQDGLALEQDSNSRNSSVNTDHHRLHLSTGSVEPSLLDRAVSSPVHADASTSSSSSSSSISSLSTSPRARASASMPLLSSSPSSDENEVRRSYVDLPALLTQDGMGGMSKPRNNKYLFSHDNGMRYEKVIGWRFFTLPPLHILPVGLQFECSLSLRHPAHQSLGDSADERYHMIPCEIRPVKRSRIGAYYGTGVVNQSGEYLLHCNLGGKPVLGSPVSFLAITEGDMELLYSCIIYNALELEADVLVSSYSIERSQIRLSASDLTITPLSNVKLAEPDSFSLSSSSSASSSSTCSSEKPPVTILLQDLQVRGDGASWQVGSKVHSPSSGAWRGRFAIPTNTRSKWASGAISSDYDYAWDPIEPCSSWLSSICSLARLAVVRTLLNHARARCKLDCSLSCCRSTWSRLVQGTMDHSRRQARHLFTASTQATRHSDAGVSHTRLRPDTTLARPAGHCELL